MRSWAIAVAAALVIFIVVAAINSTPTKQLVEWATITQVDKDRNLILTARWQYVYETDKGRIGNGWSFKIMQEGWRIKLVDGEIVEMRKS